QSNTWKQRVLMYWCPWSETHTEWCKAWSRAKRGSAWMLSESRKLRNASGRLGRNRVVLIGGNMETGWSDPVTNPDLMLVEVSKGGDLTAFEKLVDRYQGRLFHLALGITRNREDTEDVVQKSF